MTHASPRVSTICVAAGKWTGVPLRIESNDLFAEFRHVLCHTHFDLLGRGDSGDLAYGLAARSTILSDREDGFLREELVPWVVRIKRDKDSWQLISEFNLAFWCHHVPPQALWLHLIFISALLRQQVVIQSSIISKLTRTNRFHGLLRGV